MRGLLVCATLRATGYSEEAIMTENQYEPQAEHVVEEEQTSTGNAYASAESAQMPALDPTYVVENIEYYQAQYANYKKFGTTDFNWAAFFFSGWWFFYRKLYILGLIMILANYIPGLGLIGNFFSGFMGNRWYFQEMDRNLNVGDRSGAGVNKWIIYVGIIITVLVALAICGCASVFGLAFISEAGNSYPGVY